MSFLVHYDLAKWISYRSWVAELIALIGTAADGLVFHQGKEESKTLAEYQL